MKNSRIYFGDSREVLPELLSEFKDRIALLVTSPPYFVGRGYEGYLATEDEYWTMLHEVFDYSTRLIEPFGKVAINFADRYANSKEYGHPVEFCYVPEYCYMMEDVFRCDLWARIIWDKVRVMIDGARHTTNKGRFTGSMRIAPNWEYIFVWRKYVDCLKPPIKNLDMTKDEWGEWVNGIWRFSSVPRNATIRNTKFAVFPRELPKRLIKAYTEPGDIVIDPFAGTGTTIKVARDLGRIGIGIEKNREMEDTLRIKLQPDMFTDDIVEFINV